jgi:hypothetical protein
MIYSLKFILPVYLLLISVSLATEPADSAAAPVLQVQDFTLKDQYKTEHQQTFPRESVGIFALADRQGSDQLEDWIAPLFKRYEEHVDIYGVANMKGLPKVLRPMLRGVFKKSIEYPVMMDWTGSVCEALNYQSGVTDIFVVDRNGAVIHRISGEATEEKMQVCYAVIDRLIKENDDGAAAEADAPRQRPSQRALEATSYAPAQES